MSINRLYDTWHRQIAQLLAGEVCTQMLSGKRSLR